MVLTCNENKNRSKTTKPLINANIKGFKNIFFNINKIINTFKDMWYNINLLILTDRFILDIQF